MGQSFYYIICFRANGRSTLLWYSNILLMIISNLIAAINTAIVEVEGVGTRTIYYNQYIHLQSGELEYVQERGKRGR